MVRAILDGLKTQTRREVKLNLDISCTATTYDWATSLAANHYQGLAEEQIQQKAGSLRGVIHPVILDNGQMVSIICPHGKPGDRIWVAGGFSGDTQYGMRSAVDIPEPACEVRDGANPPWHVDCRANEPASPRNGTPIACMPRWASRILLEITDVRVERLNAISEEDALLPKVFQPAGSLLPDYPGTFLTPKGDFCSSQGCIPAPVGIHLRRRELEGQQPGVWVISFERI